MKHSHFFRLAVLALTSSFLMSIASSHADMANKPSTVQAEFGAGYIPDGFDTNDNVQIVAEGMFPNLCFRPGSVRVNVDHVKKQITLNPTAMHYSGPCLQVMLPWDRVIDLGVLKSGEYSVVQTSREPANRALGKLKIHAATTASADDFLYAPVSQAFYENKAGKQTLKIAGEFTNSCAKLVDVIVNVQTKVVVVLPVSEMDESSQCQSGKFAFEKLIELPKLAEGRYLIHVRSLSGKSINNLVDVE